MINLTGCCNSCFIFYKKQGYHENVFFCSAEMLNYQLNARRGFHPRRCGSPMRYLPGRCCVIIAKRRGGMRGQAHVPSFIRTRIMNHINAKGILQSRFFKNKENSLSRRLRRKITFASHGLIQIRYLIFFSWNMECSPPLLPRIC